MARLAVARIARRLRRLEPQELDELFASAGVSEEDAEDLRYADGIWSGHLRREDTAGYLVVETSVTIGQQDVTRAHERATVLRNAGLKAVGVVAGVVPPDDNDPVLGAA